MMEEPDIVLQVWRDLKASNLQHEELPFPVPVAKISYLPAGLSFEPHIGAIADRRTGDRLHPVTGDFLEGAPCATVKDWLAQPGLPAAKRHLLPLGCTLDPRYGCQLTLIPSKVPTSEGTYIHGGANVLIDRKGRRWNAVSGRRISPASSLVDWLRLPVPRAVPDAWGVMKAPTAFSERGGRLPDGFTWDPRVCFETLWHEDSQCRFSMQGEPVEVCSEIAEWYHLPGRALSKVQKLPYGYAFVHPRQSRSNSDFLLYHGILFHQETEVLLSASPLVLGLASEPMQVFYHYTTPAGFHSAIVEQGRDLLSSMVERGDSSRAEFGPGVYMSSMPPDQFESKLHILLNNFREQDKPRKRYFHEHGVRLAGLTPKAQHTWDGVALWLLLGHVTGVSPSTLMTRFSGSVTFDGVDRSDAADFCVPVLVPQSWVRDGRVERQEAAGGPLGTARDVWLLRADCLSEVLAPGGMQSTAVDWQARLMDEAAKCAPFPRHMRVRQKLGEQVDVACVAECLRNGADPNRTDCYGEAALHYAAGTGHLELLCALLEGRASVDVVTERKTVPLCGGKQETIEGMTPLMVAAAEPLVGIVAALLSARADANRALCGRPSDGRTAVHQAASAGHLENLKLLLAFGGDPDLTTTEEPPWPVPPPVRAILPPEGGQLMAEELTDSMVRSAGRLDIGTALAASVTLPAAAPDVGPVRVPVGHQLIGIKSPACFFELGAFSSPAGALRCIHEAGVPEGHRNYGHAVELSFKILAKFGALECAAAKDHVRVVAFLEARQHEAAHGRGAHEESRGAGAQLPTLLGGAAEVQQQKAAQGKGEPHPAQSEGGPQTVQLDSGADVQTCCCRCQ